MNELTNTLRSSALMNPGNRRHFVRPAPMLIRGWPTGLPYAVYYRDADRPPSLHWTLASAQLRAWWRNCRRKTYAAVVREEAVVRQHDPNFFSLPVANPPERRYFVCRAPMLIRGRPTGLPYAVNSRGDDGPPTLHWTKTGARFHAWSRNRRNARA